MPGIVSAFVRKEEAERRGDQVADLFKVTRTGGAQERFQFGEGEFDRIEVRTVGWEESEGRARLRDRGSHLGLLVDGEVIEHDDIASSQRGYQNLLDVGTKGGVVDRSIEHGGRVHPLEPKCSDDRVRLPVTAGRVVAEPRAARTPAVAPQQIGRDAAFIEKDVLPHIVKRQLLAPSPPVSRHVGAALFFGVYRFF